MREFVKDDEIAVHWVGTTEKLSDLFTKILAAGSLLKTLHLLKPEGSSGGMLLSSTQRVAELNTSALGCSQWAYCDQY